MISMRSALAAVLLLAAPGLAAAASDGRGSAPMPGAGASGTLPAQNPALAPIDALQDAVDAAWVKAPLLARALVFVDEPAGLYGGYAVHPARFKIDEPIYAYLAPVGYVWATRPDGTYAFGLSLDYVLKTPAGKILAGQQGFLSTEKQSRYRNQELYLNMTFRLSGLPAGSYVLEYTLRDRNSPKTATLSQPFTIE